MYAGSVENIDHLTTFIRRKHLYTNLSKMWKPVTRISKIVSKETFVEASKVVDKHSKVMN